MELLKYLTDIERLTLSDGRDITVNFWTGQVAEVSLISYPTDCIQTLAKIVRGYKGIYNDNPVMEPAVEQLLMDLKNTKLGTPAEMLNFVFLVNYVPRSWTHQAVRTRIGAAVVQESTRFIGIKDQFDIYVPHSARTKPERKIDPMYKDSVLVSIRNYCEMVIEGIPSQDARQVLPHSLLTHMYWSLTLRALMGVYDVRWCCQSEPGTWLPVMQQMRNLIAQKCGTEISDFLTSPVMRGENCGFNASFDRKCTWRKEDDTDR